MGACLTLDQEEKKARARSFAIDKQLEYLARQETNVIKLLLLGQYVAVIVLTNIINIISFREPAHDGIIKLRPVNWVNKAISLYKNESGCLNE